MQGGQTVANLELAEKNSCLPHWVKFIRNRCRRRVSADRHACGDLSVITAERSPAAGSAEASKFSRLTGHSAARWRWSPSFNYQVSQVVRPMTRVRKGLVPYCIYCDCPLS